MLDEPLALTRNRLTTRGAELAENTALVSLGVLGYHQHCALYLLLFLQLFN